MNLEPDERPSEKELEELLHLELRRLSDRPAPATLIPRVMSRIQAKSLVSWWQRPCLTWPALAQAVSILLLCGLVGAIRFWFGDSSLHWNLNQVPESAIGWLSPLSGIATGLATLLKALVIVTQQAGQFFWLAALSVSLLAYLSCLGVGTVFYRLAFARKEWA